MIKNATRNSKKWIRPLETALITFSDTQVITGIAILLGGYIQLYSGISSYHWQVIVALAWFSSLTHLLTLKSLRGYFRKRLEMAIWRAAFMGFVMILLIAALGPTGYISQNEAIATPAFCLFSSKRRLEVSRHAVSSSDSFDAFNLPLIFLSIFFLVTNYVLKVIGLFTTVPETWQSWLETNVSKHLKYNLECTARLRDNSAFTIIKKFWDMLRALVLLTYVLSKAFYEIGGSMLWEVYTSKENPCYLSKLILCYKIFWMAAALVWGTLRLIGLRISNKHQEESKWGFGQILAVLLLFLPLWSVYQSLFGRVIFFVYQISHVNLSSY